MKNLILLLAVAAMVCMPMASADACCFGGWRARRAASCGLFRPFAARRAVRHGYGYSATVQRSVTVQPMQSIIVGGCVNGQCSQ